MTVQAKTLHITAGETVEVTSQWAAETEKRGTAVSESEWETTAGALSGDSLVTPLATVTLAEGGCGVLKNTATLANGEVLVRWWKIEVS